MNHTRSCPALNKGDPDADCTCGLEFRIQLATEQEMHKAWRKRAEEAESRESDLRAQLAAAEKDRDIEKAEREAAWNRMKAAQDKLAAAEKRATEAEAKCAVLIDRLDVTNRGLRFSLDTFHPDDRARYKSVIEKNEAALKNPPARAQAVAEVLALADKIDRIAPNQCDWTVVFEHSLLQRLKVACAKLAALDKEK